MTGLCPWSVLARPVSPITTVMVPSGFTSTRSTGAPDFLAAFSAATRSRCRNVLFPRPLRPNMRPNHSFSEIAGCKTHGFFLSSLCSLWVLFGGRTRTRTLDPLIKSYIWGHFLSSWPATFFLVPRTKPRKYLDFLWTRRDSIIHKVDTSMP